MANKKTDSRKVLDKTFILLGIVCTVVLVIIGSLAWWGSSFITNNVKTELSSQHIVFPPKGSPALDPAEFPGLQQYAGQAVDNGVKAKAYANEFINVHLQKVAGGKTYAEVSTAAMADPTNATLQQQKAILFQGETLRGLLLNAYAFGTIGMLAQYLAFVAFVGAGLMAILVLMGAAHMTRTR
jgi:hypothetical protein